MRRTKDKVRSKAAKRAWTIRRERYAKENGREALERVLNTKYRLSTPRSPETPPNQPPNLPSIETMETRLKHLLIVCKAVIADTYVFEGLVQPETIEDLIQAIKAMECAKDL